MSELSGHAPGKDNRIGFYRKENVMAGRSLRGKEASSWPSFFSGRLSQPVEGFVKDVAWPLPEMQQGPLQLQAD